MTSSQQHQPKVRIVRPQGMPSLYVEGIAQMLVGFPNSRIFLSQFSQSNGEGESKEDVHHLACELIVPTGALIELAQGILNNLGTNKEALEVAGTEWMQKVIDVFQTLPSDQANEQEN